MAFSLFKVLKGLLIKEENTLTPKEIQITPGGSAGTKTSIVSSQTSNVTVTIPNGTTTLVGHDLSQTLTNKTIDADLNTISNIENADIKAGAAIDASKIADGSVSNAEFQYLANVTSDIQTQFTTAATNLSNHMSDTTTHGTTGDIVGTSDTQTLTNKSITINQNTINTGTAISGTVYTELNNVLNDFGVQINAKASQTDLDNHTNATSTHGVSGDIVGTSDTQTLTNKTIDADLNTISNIENADIKVGAAIDASKIANGTVSNSEFQQLDGLTSPAVGTTQTQTLTNKTLTSPTLTTPTIDIATLTEQASTPSTPASGFGKLYFKTDGSVYALNDGGSETQLGGSGQGGINFISNYKADSTTGWNLYNDGAAGGVPVDGTGGTPSDITFTTASSTALRGSKVFRLVDSNFSSGNQQGVSYDFYIDAQDKGKAIKIAFDYTFVNTKTAAIPLNNDFLVYVYDVTNASLISPYGAYTAVTTGVVTNTGNIIKQTSTPDRLELTFPAASNSTSYRLIIFCLTNMTLSPSGSATLDFTDVLVTPVMNKMVTIDTQDEMVAKAPSNSIIMQSDTNNQVRLVDELGGYVKLDNNNYIKRYGKAQTGNWTTYDDGSATPVDGTGGTFNGTFAKNATGNIIDDINSFSISTTNIGEGVSHAFTIDRAARARVLNVSFDYYNTGTGAEGDWQVWIYDITNARLIQPSNYKLSVSTSTTIFSRYNAVFQTSDSTSYRILLHKTTTNSLTLIYDNVVISPVVQPSTTLITEWQSYTPTFTNFGTVTVHEAYYRRVGGTLELDIKFTPGTTVGAEARVSFPTGLTSRTLANGIRQAGSFTIFNNTTTAKVVPLVESGVTYLTFGNQDGASGFTKMNATSAFSSGNPVAFRAEVQIAGWNTNTVSSSLDDGRIVDLMVEKTTTQSSITANTTKITYDSKIKDSHNAWSTDTYTVPVAGDYMLTVGYKTATSSTTLLVYKNGSLYKTIGSPNSTYHLSISKMIPDLKAGDTLDLRQGSTENSVGASTGEYFIQLVRVSGPQTITATETIRASYYASANKSASTSAPIDFDTRIEDTHLAVTVGSNWKFTAPAPGVYRGHTLTTVSGTAVNYYIYKNGTKINNHGHHVSGGVAQSPFEIRLLAGDYIEIRPGASVTVIGGASNADSVAQFTVMRVGI